MKILKRLSLYKVNNLLASRTGGRVLGAEQVSVSGLLLSTEGVFNFEGGSNGKSEHTDTCPPPTTRLISSTFPPAGFRWEGTWADRNTMKVRRLWRAWDHGENSCFHFYFISPTLSPHTPEEKLDDVERTRQVPARLINIVDTSLWSHIARPVSRNRREIRDWECPM